MHKDWLEAKTFHMFTVLCVDTQVSIANAEDMCRGSLHSFQSTKRIFSRWLNRNSPLIAFIFHDCTMDCSWTNLIRLNAQMANWYHQFESLHVLNVSKNRRGKKIGKTGVKGHVFNTINQKVVGQDSSVVCHDSAPSAAFLRKSLLWSNNQERFTS